MGEPLHYQSLEERDIEIVSVAPLTCKSVAVELGTRLPAIVISTPVPMKQKMKGEADL